MAVRWIDYRLSRSLLFNSRTMLEGLQSGHRPPLPASSRVDSNARLMPVRVPTPDSPSLSSLGPEPSWTLEESLWEGDFNALGLRSVDDDDLLLPEDGRFVTMRVSDSNKARIFNQAWFAQMQDEDLVSALVALAYPDRLAR